jgi:hypothetical protein
VTGREDGHFLLWVASGPEALVHTPRVGDRLTPEVQVTEVAPLEEDVVEVAVRVVEVEPE